MKKKIVLLLFIFLSTLAHSQVHVDKLTCENLIDPIGIDILQPQFSWQLNSFNRNTLQLAFEIRVRHEKGILTRGKDLHWSTGKVESGQSIHVLYSGPDLQSSAKYFWQVRVWDNHNQVSLWSDEAFFITGLFDAKDWKAPWITFDTLRATSLPIFRKSFVITKDIKNAFVHISGLGYYELYLNGGKVGDHVLDPAQTNYDDYALYVTYDLSNDLKRGNNVIGVMLGNGFYNQNKVWAPNGLSYGKPLFIFQLNVEFSDGTKAQIISDESWRWANGPVINSNVYGGEQYDARKEIYKWNTGENPLGDWMQVQLAENHPPKLVAQSLPPIKRMKEIPAVRIIKITKSKYVFDFGQNFAGWVRLKVTADAGTKITIKTSEEIFANGALDSGSIGVFATGVEQTDIYTCKGGDFEIWEPRFTYHGFRYAEVTGPFTNSVNDLLKGIVLYSSVDNAGSFKCSNEQLNKLHDLAKWTLKSNLHGIPTDCPTREKCGWLGDAHAIAPMSIYNFDMESFWIKYLFDIRSSSKGEIRTLFYKSWDTLEERVKPNGIPFMVAPGKRKNGIASPDWGTAIVQLPWYLYMYYGNLSILKEFYSDMKNWVNYIDGLATSNIVEFGLGDWCPPGSVVPLEPPVSLTSTAFHYFDLSILQRSAELLSYNVDAEYFKNKKNIVKNTFLNRFYDKENKSFGGQTANALALDMDLVPTGDEYAVSNNIANESAKRFDNFLYTGIFGLSRLFNALSHYGNEKAAYSILNKKGYKSFEFMWNKHDATTLWEILPIDSFYLKRTDKGWERSHNHPMQGGYDKWFFENILGIKPDAPGFQIIHMEPEMMDHLDWAKGQYNSPYGIIKSSWKREGDILYWDFTIPPNSVGEIYIHKKYRIITEGKNLFSRFMKIRLPVGPNGKIIYKVGSGNYSLTARLK